MQWNTVLASSKAMDFSTQQRELERRVDATDLSDGPREVYIHQELTGDRGLYSELDSLGEVLRRST